VQFFCGNVILSVDVANYCSVFITCKVFYCGYTLSVVLHLLFYVEIFCYWCKSCSKLMFMSLLNPVHTTYGSVRRCTAPYGDVRRHISLNNCAY